MAARHKWNRESVRFVDHALRRHCGRPMARYEVKCEECRHQAIVATAARDPRFYCSKCGDHDPLVTRLLR